MQCGTSEVNFLAVCTATIIISAYCRNAVESSVRAKNHCMITGFDSGSRSDQVSKAHAETKYFLRWNSDRRILVLKKGGNFTSIETRRSRCVTISATRSHHPPEFPGTCIRTFSAAHRRPFCRLRKDAGVRTST